MTLGKRPIESVGGGVEQAEPPRKKPAVDVPATKRRGKKSGSKYVGVYWRADAVSEMNRANSPQPCGKNIVARIFPYECNLYFFLFA